MALRSPQWRPRRYRAKRICASIVPAAGRAPFVALFEICSRNCGSRLGPGRQSIRLFHPRMRSNGATIGGGEFVKSSPGPRRARRGRIGLAAMDAPPNGGRISRPAASATRGVCSPSGGCTRPADFTGTSTSLRPERWLDPCARYQRWRSVKSLFAFINLVRGASRPSPPSYSTAPTIGGELGGAAAGG